MLPLHDHDHDKHDEEDNDDDDDYEKCSVSIQFSNEKFASYDQTNMVKLVETKVASERRPINQCFQKRARQNYLEDDNDDKTDHDYEYHYVTNTILEGIIASYDQTNMVKLVETKVEFERRPINQLLIPRPPQRVQRIRIP
ncbi:hypothetical protein D915_011033 [Fasciola hepatica]|uniref:Uncharacterized protein n=1 Tax=Fasciola hepatica TaxID=6192 RepID=A0A4E0QYU0_FASHE|nr:hypothetical protein D915_011033 [Fasciola hepatica]